MDNYPPDNSIPPYDDEGDFADYAPNHEDFLNDDLDKHLAKDGAAHEPWNEGKEEDESMGFKEEETTPDASSSDMQESPLEQVNLSDIPIRIDFELTRINVSISELQKMEPGGRLPLDINPRIVNLVSGGKKIGKGEIVEVGEASCIKILELYK